MQTHRLHSMYTLEREVADARRTQERRSRKHPLCDSTRRMDRSPGADPAAPRPDRNVGASVDTGERRSALVVEVAAVDVSFLERPLDVRPSPAVLAAHGLQVR